MHPVNVARFCLAVVMADLNIWQILMAGAADSTCLPDDGYLGCGQCLSPNYIKVTALWTCWQVYLRLQGLCGVGASQQEDGIVVEAVGAGLKYPCKSASRPRTGAGSDNQCLDCSSNFVILPACQSPT
jgi:hypothetical protein